MSKQNETTTYEFKAEVKQLLNILVHSLYTNREIFIRELISNSSDALDKLRFESNKGTEIADKELPLEINISLDSKKNIVRIQDNGIGMTKDEIVSNIGTIAKSGSADFIKQLADSKQEASNIIGKFGVGFYSVFMAADKVELTTKSYKKEEKAYKWISDGLGSYEIVELGDDIKRGTLIEIYLKEDAKEFAEIERVKNIIKTHSNFISFPIKVDNEQVNTVSALWREPKSTIKPEQYKEFYQFLTYDSADPLEVIHKAIDAPIQFNALLFIPSKNMDQFFFSREDYGLDLYIRRVLIQHKNKDLLPEYLGFVRGVVDSEDLPLNISRETLQENLVFTKISNSVTQQVLSHLEKIAKDDPEKYASFWKEHSQLFKMGYSDYANQEKFTSLLRFNSSNNEDSNGFTSLEEYAGRMKDSQKEIYYMTGASREAIERDPHLEIFRKKGIEVLYFFEPVDEFVVGSIMKYKEFDFKSVDQADLKQIDNIKSDEKEEKRAEELSKDDETHFSSLLTKIKEILGDRVTDVKVSERLQDSPACLVNPDNTMSAAMQKIMQTMSKDMSVPKKIFEINKDHKLTRNLLEIFKHNPTDEFITNTVEQLFESSLLLEGYLSDPHKLVGRINSMLEQSSELYKKS